MTDEVVYVIQGGGASSLNSNGCGWSKDVCFTLNTIDVHGVCYAVYDARGNGDGGICPTITGDHQNRITDYTAIVMEMRSDLSEGSRDD